MNENKYKNIIVTLITITNLLVAFFISGIVIWALGENPWYALKTMLYGAFGYEEGLGYTLYYTTNFIFTGLAFAIGFHCGLFNIGAEGQAYIGGLAVGLICLWFENWPILLVFPLAVMASIIFGGLWGAIPGYLKGRHGSHEVVTTIMFNFIASVVMVYLLSHVLRPPQEMSPESRDFAEKVWIPQMHEIFGWFGIKITQTPLNGTFFFSLICLLLVWRFIWYTRWGYEIRTVGSSETAAVYAGIKVSRNIIIAMTIGGGLSGFVGINEIMGSSHRIMLNFQEGIGFTGIAVSLIGRNHPLGIFLAALLFGILYQGGAELSFEVQSIDRHMVVLIQGLVILFAGALENLFRPQIENIVKDCLKKNCLTMRKITNFKLI